MTKKHNFLSRIPPLPWNYEKAKTPTLFLEVKRSLKWPNFTNLANKLYGCDVYFEVRVCQNYFFVAHFDMQMKCASLFRVANNLTLVYFVEYLDFVTMEEQWHTFYFFYKLNKTLIQICFDTLWPWGYALTVVFCDWNFIDKLKRP